MQLRRITLPLWSVVFVLNIFLATVSRAETKYPAEKTEPAHAKALIHYNAAQYDEALSQLRSLLSSYPEYIPALELSALIYRKTARDDDALALYEKIVKLNRGVVFSAPYHFEIGSIYFSKKRSDDARKQFELALKGGFNTGASHYFLGLIDYSDSRLADAELHFNATYWSNAIDLKGIAAFYLALVHAKMGYTPGVVYGFSAAKIYGQEQANAKEKATRDAAAGVLKVAQDVLKPFAKDRFYGNLLLQSQYDSNLPILPEVIANQQPANKKSVKGVGSLGVGYISSSLRTYQVHASYRNYYNYNFNPEAKGYSFFSNIPSVIATLFPSKRVSFGMKADGNLTYNDRLEQGKTVFRPFSVTGNFGPFVKVEYVPRLITTLELTYRPKKFFLDPTEQDTKRTGNGTYLRLSWEWASLKSWLNPSGTVSYERDDTHGREFRANIWSANMGNTFKLTARDNLSVSVDFTKMRFGERAGAARHDYTFAYRGLYSRAFNSYISGLIDMGFTRNISTVADTYQYNRFMSSIGVNLSI